MAERSASGRLMMAMLPVYLVPVVGAGMYFWVEGFALNKFLVLLIISILGFAYHVREMIKMDREIEALRKGAST